MRRSRLFSVIPSILLILAARAGESAVSVEVRPSGKAAVVFVNNGPVLSLRTPNAGLNPEQRASLAARRIGDLAAQGHPPSKIRAAAAGRSAALYWGSQVLAYATAAEAAAQSTTPAALARSWAQQLTRQLTLPPVRLRERELTVPVGEARRAAITGSSRGPFRLELDPPAAAEARIDPAGMVWVMGRSPAAARLTITCPEGSDSIPVRVAHYAGTLSQSVPVARVTGRSGIPAEVVEEAVLRAARAACVLQPGAFAVVSVDGKPPAMPQEATSIRVPVNIKLDGAGFLTARIQTAVEVQRTALPPRETELLLYSNFPEQVKTPQPLYAALLEAGKPTRLLYHHQNGTGADLRLSIVLANISDEPAEVHLVGANAGPVLDTVLVGYAAGARFLRNLASGTGYIATVPARSRVVLWTAVLKKMETASGIIEMRQLSGAQDSIVTRVLSEPASVRRTSFDIAALENGDAPPRVVTHRYPSPVRRISERYAAGDRWLFIRVGKHAIPDDGEERVLYGNYGVSYNIALTLENPTNEPRVFQLLFDPTAGIAGFASLIDGRFVGKSHVSGTREHPLVKYRLEPGERREVRLTTVPLAGSNYPATIVVRS